MTDLWKPEHPYYATEGNYYKGGGECHASYRSWGAFLEAEGDGDLDMNLVYRWDWETDPDDTGEPSSIHTLKFFFVGQRKAIHRSAEVVVTAADQDSVRRWLAPRWEKLREMWAPISTEQPAEPAST